MNEPLPCGTSEFPKAFQSNGFIIEFFDQNSWIAHDPNDPISGFIIYNHPTKTFHAWVSEIHMMFPQLARAPYKSYADCPVDENHNPKSEFMMLLAFRGRGEKPVSGSDFFARCDRDLVFRIFRNEVEQSTGKPFSAERWAECLRIASDKKAFQEWVGANLLYHLMKDDAAERFMRFAKWLKLAERIERREYPTHYHRFFAAVEEAAGNAERVVPLQKDVRAVYERGLSANQLGGKYGFRAVMRKLNFDWLPAGGRGEQMHPK